MNAFGLHQMVTFFTSKTKPAWIDTLRTMQPNIFGTCRQGSRRFESARVRGRAKVRVRSTNPILTAQIRTSSVDLGLLLRERLGARKHLIFNYAPKIIKDSGWCTEQPSERLLAFSIIWRVENNFHRKLTVCCVLTVEAN